VAPGSQVHTVASVPAPDGASTVFDYCLLRKPQGSGPPGLVPGRWQLWSDTIPDLAIPADSQFADIIIPTKDSARCDGEPEAARQAKPRRTPLQAGACLQMCVHAC
jgi:hypothetical protein